MAKTAALGMEFIVWNHFMLLLLISGTLIQTRKSS
ncbi:hypothetical protein Pint_11478 [Pistacia integerrima]|uniref:Uncharacterized protein n=1 Tax=Pistacia integerrima TaxID=434235 RepID=A0ACC0XJI2_9ROSI|nr:hypothetical protein Pint_11478 [Pistacia integerrima]